MRTRLLQRRASGILVAAITALILPGYAIAADNSTVPAATMKQLAKDLADLQQATLKVQDLHRQGASSLALSAQPATEAVIVTGADAPIRSGAADNAPALTTAKVGETLRVIDRAGEWYAVPLPKGINGATAGWVKASNVAPGIFDDVFDKVSEKLLDAMEVAIETAVKIKDAYANNQYIAVSDFSVSVGTGFSIAMSFEFKDQPPVSPTTGR